MPLSSSVVPCGMGNRVLAELLLNGNWKMKLEITASKPPVLGSSFSPGRVPQGGGSRGGGRNIFSESHRVFWEQPGSGHANAGPCSQGGLRDAPVSSQAGRLAVTPGRVSSRGRANFTLLVEKLLSEVL